VHRADQGDALLHLSQRGPQAFVGASPSTEGGLLLISAEVAGLFLLLLWARRNGARVQWRSRLGPNGRPPAESHEGDSENCRSDRNRSRQVAGREGSHGPAASKPSPRAVRLRGRGHARSRGLRA
jgi:hypothetical protein